MLKLLTAALVLLTACTSEMADVAPDAPEVTPVAQTIVHAAPVAPPPGFYTVHISPDFSEARAEVILDALTLVNDRVGRVAFLPVIGKLEAPKDWHISVDPGEFTDPTQRGWAGGIGLQCEIRLHEKATWQVVAHEVAGHCTDIPHAELPTSFMFHYTTPKSVDITDADVAAIIARIEGR